MYKLPITVSVMKLIYFYRSNYKFICTLRVLYCVISE